MWQPLGFQHFRFVSEANAPGQHYSCNVLVLGVKTMLFTAVDQVMVSRMCLILWLLEAKQCYWLYEQPSTSLLWEHPRQQEFTRERSVYRCFTWMGAFKAESPKGTHLYSSRPNVGKFARSLPKNRNWSSDIVTKTKLCDGRSSICGSKGLKASQTYTPEFGVTTLAAWLSEPELPIPDLKSAIIPAIWAPLTKKESWADANICEVMQYLTVG